MARGLAGMLALAAIGLAACGGSDPANSGRATDAVATAQQEAKRLDLPRPLAENLEQANVIVDGGREALEAKLTALEGFPVVVNQWGSWCPPCREEFPFFAESAKDHLDEVAFIGVDIQDDRGAAEDFLEEFPVPYPSIFDQDAEAVRSLDWNGVSPTTWFIDERGDVVRQRPGQYPDRAALEADLKTFLLGG